MSVAIRNGTMTITCDVCNDVIETKHVGTQIRLTGNITKPAVCDGCKAAGKTATVTKSLIIKI